MKKKKECIFGCVLLLFSSFFLAAAGGDILVNLRFYQGSRSPETSQPAVVTYYTLKPVFVGDMVSQVGLDNEAAELKRIFSLSGLRLLAKSQWGWEEAKPAKRFQLVVLNDHEFEIQFEKGREPESFQLTVSDKAADQPLLETELILPADKTAVFGFEDSLGRPYFLALQRQPDSRSVREEEPRIGTVTKPKLLFRVNPVYPAEAHRQKIQGEVVLEVLTNEKGAVTNLKVISGSQPLLDEAAIAAVKQWKYRPYLINGKPHPFIFTVTVTFKLKPGEKSVAKKKSASVPGIWPVKGYLTSTFGQRRHPTTQAVEFHNGIDIAVKEGSPVVSTADGRVIVCENRPSYGNLLIVDHGNGYATWYANLSAFNVKAGDAVKQGQTIGLVGNSGGGTGPHLHFEIRLHDQPKNPLEFMAD